MSLYDSFSDDQKEIYYQLIMGKTVEDQFMTWIVLNPEDAKQIFASLPVELQDLLYVVLHGSSRNSELIMNYYPMELSKQQQIWQNIERFRKQQVTHVSAEHALDYKVATSA
jgi:hypothetical protein